MSNDYQALVFKISVSMGASFRPASIDALESLRRLGIPESVLTFYRHYEPVQPVQGQVRLWPIRDIVHENTKLIPGASLCPHGLVVFASTHGGDAYCFHVVGKREPSIWLFSHAVDFESMSREQVLRFGKQVASNLKEFLQLFAARQLDELPID